MESANRGSDPPPPPPKGNVEQVPEQKGPEQLPLKDDIKHIREEAVMKESLAKKKIGELDAKMNRHIREAVPPTTGDESEFTPSATAPIGTRSSH